MNPAPEMSKIPEVPPLVPVRVSNTHEVPVLTQLDAQVAHVIVQNHARVLEQGLSRRECRSLSPLDAKELAESKES